MTSDQWPQWRSFQVTFKITPPLSSEDTTTATLLAAFRSAVIDLDGLAEKANRAAKKARDLLEVIEIQLEDRRVNLSSERD
jgi:hypothetical protein